MSWILDTIINNAVYDKKMCNNLMQHNFRFVGNIINFKYKDRTYRCDLCKSRIAIYRSKFSNKLNLAYDNGESLGFNRQFYILQYNCKQIQMKRVCE